MVLINGCCDVDVINDGKNFDFGGLMFLFSVVILYCLKYLVKYEGYDIGIGIDGDVDCFGIIDEKGNFIYLNEVLILFYYYLLEYKGWKGFVVCNIVIIYLLDKIVVDYGEWCFEVFVGFKYIFL